MSLRHEGVVTVVFFYICEGFRKGFREMSQENAILTHAQRFGKLVEDSLSLHANSLSSVLS